MIAIWVCNVYIYQKCIIAISGVETERSLRLPCDLFSPLDSTHSFGNTSIFSITSEATWICDDTKWIFLFKAISNRNSNRAFAVINTKYWHRVFQKYFFPLNLLYFPMSHLSAIGCWSQKVAIANSSRLLHFYIEVNLIILDIPLGDHLSKNRWTTDKTNVFLNTL